jgi:glycosyltransferase involved in cell wall biosynthesis
LTIFLEKIAAMDEKMLSIVIPVLNEEKTLKPLFKKITAVMAREQVTDYEVIFVDDGSCDSSWAAIEKLFNSSPERVKGIRFRKNFGKSAALSALTQIYRTIPKKYRNSSRKLKQGSTWFLGGNKTDRILSARGYRQKFSTR